MNILITGITGFVGSHLADYILSQHPEVKLFGLKRWRSPMENIRHIEAKLKLIDGDLNDLPSVIAIIQQFKPDWIFHLAAQSRVSVSYSMPIETLNTNVLGTANLLEAVRLARTDPRIHICSSSEVYGDVHKEDTPITENCPLRPVSPYAVSKVAEDMLGYMYYQAHNLKTIRSRAFTHTGPRRGEAFVVSASAKQIARIEKGIQEPVIKVGNLDSIRTFCDVRDIVRAYWLLLEKGELGEIYNIAGNETMTIRDMLQLLLSLSSCRSLKISLDKSLLRPKDVTLQIADCTKFKKITGWEPGIPFKRTLRDTLNYWRQFHDQARVNTV